MKCVLSNFNIASLNSSTIDIRRDLRKEMRSQFSQGAPTDDLVRLYLSDCFMKNEELMMVDWGACLIDTFNDKIKQVVEDHNHSSELYEAINIKRLISMVHEAREPLKKNYECLMQLKEVQENLVEDVTSLLREVSYANSTARLKELGSRGYELMCAIAGNINGTIQSETKVNEAHKTHIQDMSSRFKDGYIYHWSIQDELKKVQFEEIYATLTGEQRKLFHDISTILDQVNGAVLTAYGLNWRQVALIKKVYSLLYEVMQKKM